MKYRGLSPSSGQPIEVEVADGRICSAAPVDAKDISEWIAPGLIDIQVNGFAGVDYNSPTTPLDEIARSIEVQRGSGVTRLLPTVITGSHDNIRDSLANLARARRELDAGEAFVGFHVEGPWIAPEDGPRGAHPSEHVRAASLEEFERFQEAAEGNIRLLTLAPEVPGAVDIIDKLVERGVVVSIGHSAASGKDIAAAIRAGATISTHLGNGAHEMLPRHDNYMIHQLAADELWAGLIGDAIHLPPPFLKVAVRAKGVPRTILTTDAAPPAGGEPGVYRFGHLEVELTADQCVRLTSNGRLAGSALSMDRGVENLMRHADLSLEDALRTATVNPAESLQIEDRREFLKPGDLADLIFFELDEETKAVRVVRTLSGASN